MAAPAEARTTLTNSGKILWWPIAKHFNSNRGRGRASHRGFTLMRSIRPDASDARRIRRVRRVRRCARTAGVCDWRCSFCRACGETAGFRPPGNIRRVRRRARGSRHAIRFALLASSAVRRPVFPRREGFEEFEEFEEFEGARGDRSRENPTASLASSAVRLALLLSFEGFEQFEEFEESPDIRFGVVSVGRST